MEQIAEELLLIEAVKLSNNKDKFLWSSGIKSPIYTDNRLIMSYPKTRAIVEKQLSNLIKIKFPEVNFIIGTATAGIPHAAYVSSILDLPMGYVRSSKKDHGKQNIIEGKIPKNSNIVVIEDLFSTGASVLKVINELKKANYNVLGAVAIFSYELNVLEENMKDIKHYSLTNIKELLNISYKKYIIDAKGIGIINNFLKELN